jgi:leader peptidase (prepilin peptidase)/N-methyltransferase
MPEGKSIVHPGSYCPRCQHPVRGYDNIPVLSWLILRGRCRDCRAPISPRYPLVEATGALLFLVIAVCEVTLRATNLPGHAGPAATFDTWAIAAYHLSLLCALLCVALIAYDRKRVPWRLTAVILGVGLVAAAVLPLLQPVSLTGKLSGQAGMGRMEGLATGLAGGATGLLFGAAAWPAALTRRGRRSDARVSASLHGAVLTGTFLGWQAVVGIAAAVVIFHTIVVAALCRVGKRPLWLWPALLALTTLGYICIWDRIAAWLPWLVTGARGMTLVGACLATWIVSTLVWFAFLRPT